MKQILLKIALFFGLLAIPLVALFILPYSEEFAYHYVEHDCYNHGAWIYDRIVHNQAPIDIAFVGSSHTIHAFQDKKMEEIILKNPTEQEIWKYARSKGMLTMKDDALVKVFNKVIPFEEYNSF